MGIEVNQDAGPQNPSGGAAAGTDNVDTDDDYVGCESSPTRPVECEGGRATEGQQTDEPTAADFERAVRRIAMPRLAVHVQPGTRTLVNVPTIFYAESRALRRSVTLLGEDVDVEATPTTFTWHHGDGTSQTTTSPGHPYPDHDVTYRYRHVAHDLTLSVDTTYTVRYRVGGGAWRQLGVTLTANGPAATLDVRQAAPVLVAP